MKKLFIPLMLMFLSSSVSAQTAPLHQMLSHYYQLKNALVTGNVTEAAASAQKFLKTVNTIDYKIISEGNNHILVKDAEKIAAGSSLEIQRRFFTNLSQNMVKIAKAVKLSDEPVYHAYCPMKKAHWLSNEKEIRNPYYGSSMLTCGEVKETIQ